MAVIDRVLQACPAEWDEQQVREAVSNAYPFGERKYHPYRVWLDCVQELLDQRFPRPAVDLGTPNIQILHLGGPRNWWLELHCNYCRLTSGQSKGCLMCARLYDEMNWLLTSYEWMTKWKPMLLARSESHMLFAEWLEEHGHDELAVVFYTAKIPEKN